MTTPLRPRKHEVIPEPSMNRLAFRLGLYAGLPAADALLDPLVELSHLLSISRVLMLQAAVARMCQYECESRATDDPQRSGVYKDLYRTELVNVRRIAERLWGGETELAGWYQAGFAVGCVIPHLETGGINMNLARSYAFECLRALSATETPSAGAVTKILEWLPPLAQIVDFGEIRARPETPTVALVERANNESLYLKQIESMALTIVDREKDGRTEEQRAIDDRNQLIYELMSSESHKPQQVLEIVNYEGSQRSPPWERLQKTSQLTDLANQFADLDQRPRLKSRERGRPRNNQK